MNNEEKIQIQQQLLDLYESQIADLVMMSKIELGDDVIEEIKRLKSLLIDKKGYSITIQDLLERPIIRNNF